MKKKKKGFFFFFFGVKQNVYILRDYSIWLTTQV